VIDKLRTFVMRLPIVKILRRHHDDKCEAACLREELLRQQHDISRRVHVIEWQTFPHTHAKGTDRDDH
jgi:hypothetical protein